MLIPYLTYQALPILSGWEGVGKIGELCCDRVLRTLLYTFLFHGTLHTLIFTELIADE